MKSYRKFVIDKYLSIARWFIPIDLQNDQWNLMIARDTVTLALLASVSTPFFAWLYHFLNFDKAGVIVILGGAAMLCSPFALKFSGRIAFAREVFICSFYAFKLCLAFYLGGIEAPTLPWFLLCPMIALVLGGVKPGAIWGVIVTVTVFVIFYLQTTGFPFPPTPISNQSLLQVVSILGLFVFSAIILLFFEFGAYKGVVAGMRKSDLNEGNLFMK